MWAEYSVIHFLPHASSVFMTKKKDDAYLIFIEDLKKRNSTQN